MNFKEFSQIWKALFSVPNETFEIFFEVSVLVASSRPWDNYLTWSKVLLLRKKLENRVSLGKLCHTWRSVIFQQYFIGSPFPYHTSLGNKKNVFFAILVIFFALFEKLYLGFFHSKMTQFWLGTTENHDKTNSCWLLSNTFLIVSLRIILGT